MVFRIEDPATGNLFGVIAYIPGSGLRPSDDETHFDGWYTDEALAGQIFDLFIERYPNAVVSIVRRRKTRWLDDQAQQAP